MIGFSYDLKDLGNQKIELALIGYMDEQTLLPEVDKLVSAKKLIVNFGRVNAILSVGIKIWIKFMTELEKFPHMAIEFKNCSKQIVGQINMTKGFLPDNAQVTSLYVPVFCGQCKRQFRVLRKNENIKEEIHKVIPELDVPDCQSFPACKENFELECTPATYLKFASK